MSKLKNATSATIEQKQVFDWLREKLRRLSYQWPPRTHAKNLAKIDRGKYRCACCKNIFGLKDISLDHIDPVIGPEGFINIQTYIERLFCPANGFQVLCSGCHDQKTLEEKKIRLEYKNKQKSLDNED